MEDALYFNSACNNVLDNMDVNLNKSTHDQRLYTFLKLANDVKVLLISDSETDKSSACLSVNVGRLLKKFYFIILYGFTTFLLRN